MSTYPQKQPYKNKPIPATSLVERKLKLESFDKENGISWTLGFEYMFGGVHLVATGFSTNKNSGDKPKNIRARFTLLTAHAFLSMVRAVIEAAKTGTTIEPYQCDTYTANSENRKDKIFTASVNVGYDVNGIYIGMISAVDPSIKRRFYLNWGQFTIVKQGDGDLIRLKSSIFAAEGWRDTFNTLLTIVANSVLDIPPHVEARSNNTSTPAPSKSHNDYDDDITY